MKTLKEIWKAVSTALRIPQLSEEDEELAQAAADLAEDIRFDLFATEEERKMQAYWLAYEAGRFHAEMFAEGKWWVIQSNLDWFAPEGMERAGYLAGIQEGLAQEAKALFGSEWEVVCE